MEVSEEVPLFALARTLHDVVASGGAVLDRVCSPRAEAAKAEEPGEAPREEQREAYDADEPLAPVAPEDVQRILHTLDQLEMSNAPRSQVPGGTAGVLAALGDNRTCRRNICVPARGVVSLNLLVTASMAPYLQHPDKVRPRPSQ